MDARSRPRLPSDKKSMSSDDRVDIEARFAESVWRNLGHNNHPFTGLRCVACKHFVAIVTYQSPAIMVFHCPSCRVAWDWFHSLSRTRH